MSMAKWAFRPSCTERQAGMIYLGCGSHRQAIDRLPGSRRRPAPVCHHPAIDRLPSSRRRPVTVCRHRAQPVSGHSLSPAGHRPSARQPSPSGNSLSPSGPSQLPNGLCLWLNRRSAHHLRKVLSGEEASFFPYSSFLRLTGETGEINIFFTNQIHDETGRI